MFGKIVRTVMNDLFGSGAEDAYLSGSSYLWHTSERRSARDNWGGDVASAVNEEGGEFQPRTSSKGVVSWYPLHGGKESPDLSIQIGVIVVARIGGGKGRET